MTPQPAHLAELPARPVAPSLRGMYVPDHFAVTDADEVAEMLRRTPFGCLITHGPDGLFASHLPFLHDPQRGVLAGHLARANPHERLATEGEALVVFQGPHAYVSPGWYPSKAEHGRVVPTWNYEAVHVYGRLSWRRDRDWLLGLVTALTKRFEAAQPAPWRVDDAPADHIERLLGAIVGLEVRIERVVAKRKFSQNRPQADVHGVVAGLSASPAELDRALAEAMRAHPA